ncbi:MAG: hypothetical protein AAF224_02565 [Pseudomonadota bacterium]
MTEPYTAPGPLIDTAAPSTSEALSETMSETLDDRLSAIEAALVHAVLKMDALYTVMEERFEILSERHATVAAQLDRQADAIDALASANAGAKSD